MNTGGYPQAPAAAGEAQGNVMRRRSSSAASVGLGAQARRKSPRAFQSLAQGIRGIARARAMADDGLPRGVDVSALVQRIAVTLSSPEIYKKAVANIFSKFCVASAGGQPEEVASAAPGPKVLPAARIPEILMHWHIPDMLVPLFWALLRKQESNWDARVLPDVISFEDFQAVLLKMLRRVRHKYADSKVDRTQFVRENTGRLEQDYDVAGSCGKGSFGECFWITHRMSKRGRVCKKIFKQDQSVPSEEVVAELNHMKLLDHPNILRVYEWFEAEDAYFLVLEAAQGGDLKNLLARAKGEGRSGLEESFLCSAMGQSLRALAYVHSMHVVHRDIKPANLLLATPDLAQARLLLADFGVAELFEEHGTMSSIVRGSVAYMAPEVFLNTVSPRSDVWALGIVTYELFCGVRPFYADNAMAMYSRLKTAAIDYAPVHDAGASAEAVAFVGRLLTKPLEERPSAVSALEDPWITDHATRAAKPQGRSARKMRAGMMEYSKKGHFNRAAMSCIAAQLETTRIESLNQIFESLDADCDGKLSTAELAAGLAEMGVDPDAIGQLVDAVDMNNDGSIQYSEFVASLLTTQGKLVEEVLYHAFHVIDANHDGVISLDELKAMLSSDGPLTAVLPDGKTVEQVLIEVDTSHDGVITFDEFKTYLMQEQGEDSLEKQVESIGSDEPRPDEKLASVMPRLAEMVGRPPDMLAKHAERLAETHWISTVGDLQGLREADWPRLGLPLKLEHTLRTYVGA